jgi:glucosamine kinase
VAYYLGIDGGGSKTICSIGNETSELATATSGPSNITRVGEEGARESLHRAIREACAIAKVNPQQVQRARIGVAGAGQPEIANAVRQIVAEVIPGEIQVTGDIEIALAAAFGQGPGVIVIAGTGSIAYGRNAKGQIVRAGGWGFAISDEGSAHWIGRAVVTTWLRALDLGTEENQEDRRVAESSPLLCEMKEAWDVHSFDEFLRKANSHPDFPALLPAIITAADAGNELAGSVLAQAGAELAQLAGIVISRLFAADIIKASIPLAMVGGVFKHSARVREVFCDEVRKLDLRIEVSPQIVEPVLGALKMARTAARQPYP